MSVRFTVDPRSGVPIYVQLVGQVKRAVALGTLGPGERLPTVKALAVELTVNVNTVARAYRELERDRVIETRSGRGSFVRVDDEPAAIKRAVADVADAALDTAVREASALGFDPHDVRTSVDRAIARWFPEEAILA